MLHLMRLLLNKDWSSIMSGQQDISADRFFMPFAKGYIWLILWGIKS